MIVALCCQAYVKTYILTTYFFLNQRKLKLQEQANKQEYKANTCLCATWVQRHVFAYKYSVLFTL